MCRQLHALGRETHPAVIGFLSVGAKQLGDLPDADTVLSVWLPMLGPRASGKCRTIGGVTGRLLGLERMFP
jgi:hypothetical protein